MGREVALVGIRGQFTAVLTNSEASYALSAASKGLLPRNNFGNLGDQYHDEGLRIKSTFCIVLVDGLALLIDPH